MSCSALAYLSCQLCRTVELHNHNYCTRCKVFNAFGPPVKVEKFMRDFLVRADRARANRQRPPGISDKEWARRQIVAAANAKRARDRAAGEADYSPELREAMQAGIEAIESELLEDYNNHRADKLDRHANTLRAALAAAGAEKGAK